MDVCFVALGDFVGFEAGGVLDLVSFSSTLGFFVSCCTGFDSPSESEQLTVSNSFTVPVEG
jgi:hypothetical protein